MPTKTIEISEDERFPVYAFAVLGKDPAPSGWRPHANVDAKTVARWKRTAAAYERMQDELAALFEGSP